MSDGMCHVCGVALAFCSAGELHAAEVSRLREALAAVVKACRNCGGSGIAVRRYNFPDLVCGADGCKIARAALVAGKREGG